MLSLPLPEGRYPPLSLSPKRQREETHQALARWLLHHAREKETLLVWEDLHWADPSTIDFLNLLITQCEDACTLIVLTFRPEFSADWSTAPRVSHLTLSRLDTNETKTMVKHVAGNTFLPTEVLHEVAAKTDGVPLFIEELTKMVLEATLSAEHDAQLEPQMPLSTLAIPVTLQDSLMARLDRLGGLKEVAQLAATIGREFSYALLKAVSPLDEVALQHALNELVASELMYRRGPLPESHYSFKHALIQDAAYQSLLKRSRQRYHRQIAQVLEAQFPGIAATQPELLAHHCSEAGLKEQAVAYWEQAGDKAIKQSAYVEAVHHLNKGLVLLETLPASSAHAAQELRLRMSLGHVLVGVKGFGAPEVRDTYARAQELCEVVGEAPQLVTALSWIAMFHLYSGNIAKANDLTEQLLRIAQDQQVSVPLLRGAYASRGITFFYLGKFETAANHTEKGINLYNPDQYHSQALLYGLDLGVVCLMWHAYSQWMLGYPEQAYSCAEKALALANELSHMFTRATALFWIVRLFQFARLNGAFKGRMKALLDISNEQGFPVYSAGARIMWGLERVKQDRNEAGLNEIQETLKKLRERETIGYLPYYLALLAEAQGILGLHEDGLRTIEQALQVVEDQEERWWQAELYRLKAELLLHQGASRGDTEQCLHKALEIAKRQHAKSLELRAVMCLSRLWQKHGKREEARQLVDEIYLSFSEGHDTEDLKQARALLQRSYGRMD